MLTLAPCLAEVTELQEDSRQSQPLKFDYSVAMGDIQSVVTQYSTLGMFLYSRFCMMQGENLIPEGGGKALE